MNTRFQESKTFKALATFAAIGFPFLFLLFIAFVGFVFHKFENATSFEVGQMDIITNTCALSDTEITSTTTECVTPSCTAICGVVDTQDITSTWTRTTVGTTSTVTGATDETPEGESGVPSAPTSVAHVTTVPTTVSV